MQRVTLPESDREFMRRLMFDCYCHEEVINPEGQTRFGFSNFKRVYGMPAAFRRAVHILSGYLSSAPLCAPDIGIAPFVGALANHAGLPSVYVRAVEKYYYLSYGSSQVDDQPRLIGERLPPGTIVQIFDDVLSDGASITEAVGHLKTAALVPTSALCLVNVRPSHAAGERLAAIGVQDVRYVFEATEIRPLVVPHDAPA